MSIPPIRSYRMPAEMDLPDNEVSWAPRSNRAVLLIHDMQRYFLDFFPAGVPPLTTLLHNVVRLRATAVRLGIPVVYTAQPGGMSRDERGLLHDFWGPGMGRDPAKRRIVAELAPGPDDLVLTKWRYSAFSRSRLEGYLRERGRDQLIICGVYAHVGCLMTAQDAFARDVEPFLVADAMADFTRDYHLLALRYAAERCAVTLSTQAVVATLDAAVDLIADR